jgi:hypothetical protein
MKTVEITVYSFDELDERAKERARDWYRSASDYPWYAEAKDSLTAFCDHFGVTVKDYSYGDSSGYVTTDAANEHFRGVKLSEQDRNTMPTGLWLDCELFMHFYDEFKNTGNAKGAFEDALYNFTRAVRNDVEFYFSDECIDENIQANEYQFTKNGTIF